MSENRNPLVPHPTRRHVWVREHKVDDSVTLEARPYTEMPHDADVRWHEKLWSDAGYRGVTSRIVARDGLWWVEVTGVPPTPGLFTDRPGLVEQVVTWAAAAVAGWTTFAVAHLVAEAVVLVLGVRGSVLAAAGIGAVAGVAAWAAERRRR